jgi:predicted nucleic acid-binding protein
MPARPKVFLDADVIFAGAAAPSVQGASYVVLRMGEITLLDCITSAQVITEVERNLTNKLPQALAEFQLLLKRCVRVAPDPAPEDLAAYVGQADPKDLSILVAASRENCSYLLTFNTRHFNPTGSHPIVQPPGQFLQAIRSQLSMLSSAEEWVPGDNPA